MQYEWKGIFRARSIYKYIPDYCWTSFVTKIDP